MLLKLILDYYIGRNVVEEKSDGSYVIKFHDGHEYSVSVHVEHLKSRLGEYTETPQKGYFAEVQINP